MRTNLGGDDLGHCVVRSAVLHGQHASVPHHDKCGAHNWNHDVIHHILGDFRALQVQQVRRLIDGKVIQINDKKHRLLMNISPLRSLKSRTRRRNKSLS